VSLTIRTFGDPVLKRPAALVTEHDLAAVRPLTDDMFATMRAAPGIGLAATQVGVQKRFFVYETLERSGVLVNPEIVESDGEWTYDEGCLSIPGLAFTVTRPKHVHVRATDLDGNEVDFDADELLARLVQHEIDHLDGTLVLARLEPEQRKGALRILRHHALGLDPGEFPAGIKDRSAAKEEL
jgi:peptide deformylase